MAKRNFFIRDGHARTAVRELPDGEKLSIVYRPVRAADAIDYYSRPDRTGKGMVAAAVAMLIGNGRLVGWDAPGDVEGSVATVNAANLADLPPDILTWIVETAISTGVFGAAYDEVQTTGKS